MVHVRPDVSLFVFSPSQNRLCHSNTRAGDNASSSHTWCIKLYVSVVPVPSFTQNLMFTGPSFIGTTGLLAETSHAVAAAASSGAGLNMEREQL
jgi:hypothetical protein